MTVSLKDSGVFTFGSTEDDHVVTLNIPLMKNKTFVLFTISNASGFNSGSNNAGDYLIAPELTDITGGKAADVTFHRVHQTTALIEVTWRVFLLTTGTVEHGSTNLNPSSPFDISVTTFVAGESFSIAYMTRTTGTFGGDLRSQAFSHKVHNNGSDVLTIDSPLSGQTGIFAYWQIVTFPGSTVQTIEGTSTTSFDGFTITTVDLTKTMTLGSFKYTTTSIAGNEIKSFFFNDSTTLQVAAYASSTAVFVAYVVEDDGMFVQHGSVVDWTASSTTVTFGTLVDETKALCLHGGPYVAWGPHDISSSPAFGSGFLHRNTFLNVGSPTTQFRINRGTTGGSNASTDWQVIEFIFDDGFVYKKLERGVARGIGRGVE